MLPKTDDFCPTDTVLYFMETLGSSLVAWKVKDLASLLWLWFDP